MKVTVFGVGYVGLVQAAVFADSGHQVVCVDVDHDRIDKLRRGIMPIYEPGLEDLVRENHGAGRLRFTSDARVGVEHGEFQFIAVGTPQDEDGSADLQYVLSVAETIAYLMVEPTIVVNKSTVPVGTADIIRQRVANILVERGLETGFDVVANPEFLKEGAALADCTRPDRIIVGTDNPWVAERMRELYAPVNRNHDRMMIMDIRSAELTKYAANAMLATKISFINEMANLAEILGADIEAVRQGIGADRRIGYDFIYPGCGYGGSCFPKDVQALIRTARKHDYPLRILAAVEAVNNDQKQRLFHILEKHFGGDLEGRTIALWGLSFKPGTDDMRAAPSRVLMESLWAAGAMVRAHDPVAMEECRRIYGERPDLALVDDLYATLDGADALVVVTDWQHFKILDLEQARERLANPVIVDGRNLYSPQKLRQAGFRYYAIGRPKTSL